jgi:hypothetical protein
LGASNTLANANEANNSWNKGFSVSNADFESLDLSLATVKRNADGSLPETALFRLKSTSALIDKGVNVGLPFQGKAPDLGAIEFKGSLTTGRVSEETTLTSYPTQVENELHLKFNTSIERSTVSIQSLEDGKVYLKNSIKGEDATINCKSLKPGVYIGVVERKGVMQKFKFIKQ